jgi:Cu/Ag efflux protein CusF
MGQNDRRQKRFQRSQDRRLYLSEEDVQIRLHVSGLLEGRGVCPVSCEPLVLVRVDCCFFLLELVVQVLGRAILAIAMICAGCARQPGAPVSATSSGDAQATEGSLVLLKRYSLRGQVVRMDTKHSVVTVRHEAIQGWMDAMTMDFPVKDDAAFRALHSGDRITATLFVSNKMFWIGEVHREF